MVEELPNSGIRSELPMGSSHDSHPKTREVWRSRAGQTNSRGEDIMEPQQAPVEKPDELADDILEGADAIATFLFGAKGTRRRVYYLVESSRLPVFRFGSMLCARKSVLLKYISGQEDRVLMPKA